MSDAFHVSLDRLTNPQPSAAGEVELPIDEPILDGESNTAPSFYIETFSCQMNEHDSEKVAGVHYGEFIDRPLLPITLAWSSTTLAASAKKPLTNFFRVLDSSILKWFAQSRRQDHWRPRLCRAARGRRDFRTRSGREPSVWVGQLPATPVAAGAAWKLAKTASPACRRTPTRLLRRN